MSLSGILLVLFLLLYAVTALGWVAVSATVLGIVALATAIAFIVEGWHPLPIVARRRSDV